MFKTFHYKIHLVVRMMMRQKRIELWKSNYLVFSLSIVLLGFLKMEVLIVLWCVCNVIFFGAYWTKVLQCRYVHGIWRNWWWWRYKGGVSMPFLFRVFRYRWTVLPHWWRASCRGKEWGITPCLLITISICYNLQARRCWNLEISSFFLFPKMSCSLCLHVY